LRDRIPEGNAPLPFTVCRVGRAERIDPEAYLRLVLRRIVEHPIDRVADLLPWSLFPGNAHATEAAL